MPQREQAPAPELAQPPGPQPGPPPSGPPATGAGSLRSGGIVGRERSISSSCFASIIAILKSFASRSIRSRSIPCSDAVRTSRSPNPNIRPKTDSVRIASLIFSSEESVVFLLITPSTWMIRRFVMRYSSFRKRRMLHRNERTPNTNRASVRMPRICHSVPEMLNHTLSTVSTIAPRMANSA